MQRAIELLDNSGIVLTESDAREASESLHQHLKCYAWLASNAWMERRLLFQLRPKHHAVWHIAEQLAAWRVNFSLFHCFDEESFLGKIKNICQKTHGKTATRRVYQRYLLRFAMIMEQHRRITAEL